MTRRVWPFVFVPFSFVPFAACDRDATSSGHLPAESDSLIERAREVRDLAEDLEGLVGAAPAIRELPQGFVRMDRYLAAKCPGPEWDCDATVGFKYGTRGTLVDNTFDVDRSTSPLDDRIDYLKEMARKGHGSVVTGRCAGGGGDLFVRELPGNVEWHCLKQESVTGPLEDGIEALYIQCIGRADEDLYEKLEPQFEKTCDSVMIVEFDVEER